MATFDGVFSGELTVAVTGLAPEPVDISDAHSAAHQSPAIFAADLTLTAPLDFLPVTLSGALHESSFETYYGRVWFVPLDFGSIISTETLPGMMWNASDHQVEITSILSSGDTGLSVDPGLVGSVVLPMAELPVPVTVVPTGEADVAGVFRVNLDDASYADLHVSARRVRFWQFPPNWDSEVDVTLEYRTEVITSHEGDEQRIAVRQTPRKNISYQAIASARGFRSFAAFMNVHQRKVSFIPEFGRGAYLALPTTTGDDVIEIAEAVDWMQVGQTIVLFDGGVTDHRVELRSIVDVDGQSVTLNIPLKQDWEVGAKVYPAVEGQLPATISSRMNTNNTATISMNFDVAPGTEIPLDPGSPAVVHDGREVLLKRPNWADLPTADFEALRDQVDYGFGRTSHFTPVDFNNRMLKATYLGKDRDEVEDFMRFFCRQMGQRGEFFMPTFTEDLIMTAAATSASPLMRVEGAEIANDFGDRKVYRNIAVFLDDGTRIIRTVSSMTVSDDGADTIITLSSNWGRNFQPSAVLMACWLPLWRFASDALTVSWVTDGAAQFAVNLKTLEYFPQE